MEVITRVIITPISTAPAAIRGTIATLKAIPMAGFVPDYAQNENGMITGTTLRLAYLRSFVLRQGYAQAVDEQCIICSYSTDNPGDSCTECQRKHRRRR